MSSCAFKKAAKVKRRIHKERSQPADREHLGFLQKKKDYKERAVNYQKNQEILKKLKRKALNKNPDEFFFKMVKTEMNENGVRKLKEDKTVLTDEQSKLIETQDIRYVRYLLSIERKKLEKMKASYHFPKEVAHEAVFVKSDHKLLKNPPKAKHIKFVDSKECTAVEKEKEKKEKLPDSVLMERANAFKLMQKREKRIEELNLIEEKMKIKLDLMEKNRGNKKIAEETKDQAAIYKWKLKRK